MTELGPGPLLVGRRAVITGGGAGIGRGIAELFARHGAHVVIGEIDGDAAAATVKAIVAAGGTAEAVVADATSTEGVAALVGAAGVVDVLVNNIGHYLYRGVPFLRSTEEQWDELYRVNLLHVFRMTHAVAPGMVERGSGSVITLSTVEAFRAAPNNVVYSAFKGAISAFTRSLAIDLGTAGVRVNAIAPDLTETPQLPYTEWVPEEQRPMIPTWVPVGRFGTPEDLAGCALFLASDLSAFVTGTTVHADGGSLAAGGWYRTRSGGWTNRPRDP
jgi:2-hydroxycyclohexanecarboxyl-CoA dehydrogenase